MSITCQRRQHASGHLGKHDLVLFSKKGSGDKFCNNRLLHSLHRPLSTRDPLAHFLGQSTHVGSRSHRQFLDDPLLRHAGSLHQEMRDLGLPLVMALWELSDGVDYVFPDFNAGKPQAGYLTARNLLLAGGL